MFGLFRDPIGDGVKAGLTQAFAPGGAASKAFGEALDKGFAPIREELTRLRRIEARYTWHPLATAKPWVFDGRHLLLYRDGDLFFGCYQAADDLSPGYWDADQEYGGQPIEPPPTHFYILRKSPVSALPVVQGGADLGPFSQAKIPGDTTADSAASREGSGQ